MAGLILAKMDMAEANNGAGGLEALVNRRQVEALVNRR